MFGHTDEQGQSQDASQTADTTANTPVADLQVPTPLDISAIDTIGASSVPELPPAPAPAAPELPTLVNDGTTATTTTDELLDIKQQALQRLTPLVGHLDQDPEEKFRTTMMMIQAADNDSLIKTAYDAALQITDDKVRAQALLDIVNEINYFTHNASSEA